MSSHTVPVLSMRGITKSFSGTLALDNVDFQVQGGSVHGLVGENGAGKSTLLKILAGDCRASAGSIEIDGEPVSVSDPMSAREHGIGIVYQELSLVPNLTVAENVSLGIEPSRYLALDGEAIRETAQRALDALGVASIGVDRIVSHLSLAERQLVEIARVLTLKRPRVLVFDEPTAALNFRDVERLFTVMSRLRDVGAGVIFVSHRYREVLDICDACSALRNGRNAGGLLRSEATIEKLVELTIGRSAEPAERGSVVVKERGEPLVSVDRLSVGALVHNVSFDVLPGEVVAICGLLGMGQTEIARSLIGDGDQVTGDVRIAGSLGRPRSPRHALRLGVGLIPENRQDEGLFPDMTVRANITVASLSTLLLSPVLRLVAPRRERTRARVAGERSGIAPDVLGRAVRTLSGGNQQKSLFARWLLRGCKLLICIEPTRGVDVGAKAEIHRQLRQLASEGTSVIVVSTDLPEVLAIADRVLVVYRGTITAELEGSATDEAALLTAMQGGESASVQPPVSTSQSTRVGEG